MNLKTELLIYASIFFLGCFTGDKSESKLNHYDLESGMKQTVKLSDKLHEISGMAINEKGDLFAHNDEIGVIYKLDKSTGRITKTFQVGRFGIEGDFEGLAFVNDKFYLIESSGGLYVFNEGENLESVEFTFVDLPFSDKYEIEGLCFDPTRNGLLLAAKEYAGKNYKGKRAIYFFDLTKGKTQKEPVIVFPLKELKNKFGIKDFYPSGIEYNRVTKTFYIVSAKGNPAIIEMDVEGNLLSGEKLNKKHHLQPEGITFLTNGEMIIADEGRGGGAKLTFYNAKIE